MKILVVNKEPPYPRSVGGTEVVIRKLFSRLARRGHEIYMVCGTPEPLPKQEVLEGIEVHYVRTFFPLAMPTANLRYLLTRYLFYPLSWTKICRVAREREVDIIYEFVSPAPSFAPFVARFLGIPCIARVWEYFGGNWFVNRDLLTASIGFVVEKFIPHLPYTLIITSSREMLNLLIEKGRYPAQKTRFLPQGVDLVRFKPLAKRDFDNPTMIHIGRFTKQKAQARLIRAIPRVVEEFPTARFVFVGEGPLLPACTRLATDLKVDEYVDFRGRVNDENLLALLQNATLHVIPSLQECVPLTGFESMACGVPVILSDAPGVAEFATDGHDTLVVKAGDANALAQGIVRLLSNKDLYDKIRNNASMTVKAYDWDKVVLLEERLLRGVLGSGS